MTAVEASSVRVGTMADGTLRLTLDIEPRFAQDAFRLFGSPGTPVALAALKPAVPEPEPAKGGVAAKWLGMRCAEPEFQDWLKATEPGLWRNIASRLGAANASLAEYAASMVRDICEVKSRADIDNDPAAMERFQRLIRGPWAKYQGSKQ